MAKRTRSITDALYRAVSRKRAPSGENPAELVARAEKAFGSKKAVAEQLGVSPRTVERWAAGEGRIRNRPKGSNMEKLRRLATDSPQARQRELSPRRAARIRNHGAKIRATGNMGPVVGGKSYRRPRSVEIPLSGGAMAAVMDAWLAGDDQGALDALHAAIDSEYVAGFELPSDVELLNFLR